MQFESYRNQWNEVVDRHKDAPAPRPFDSENPVHISVSDYVLGPESREASTSLSHRYAAVNVKNLEKMLVAKMAASNVELARVRLLEWVKP